MTFHLLLSIKCQLSICQSALIPIQFILCMKANRWLDFKIASGVKIQILI
jgi:hypothetical protein